MAVIARLRTIIQPFRHIWATLCVHFVTFKDAIRKNGLAVLTHPQRIKEAAIANFFVLTSNGFIAHEDTTCVPSLLASAQGKILELGPGPGNQIHRFDKSRVDFIYAVEPNPHFGDEIAAKLRKHGLQDNYKLLTCGIEDSEILRREGVSEESMDTVLSIQVLCAVDDPHSVMKEVWKLLKPGGKFVFWEHGRSKDTITAVTQACWNPFWSSLIGCSSNRDIKAAILAAGEWQNLDDIEEPEDPYGFLPRTWGVLTKAA